MTSVLIVNADPMSRNLWQLILERAGYTVFKAEDGVDALVQVKQLQPNAVILNRFMPRLDGLAVCKTLRGNRDTARLPIIMLSVLAGFTAAQEAVQAGASKYLTKPMKRQDLLDALSDSLQVDRNQRVTVLA